MADSDMWESLRPHEIPQVVEFNRGRGGLPKARIRTERSKAEVYLHGAQVTGFEKNGEPAMLFLSQHSQFAEGKAIRGGVPICFPWFGPRTGHASHGYARITDWRLISTEAAPQGGATLHFQLPEAAREWEALRVEFVVSVTDRLAMELIVTNRSEDQTLTFENCLHTYFAVGDIEGIAITGLKGVHYLDETKEGAPALEREEAISIKSRIDRTYLDTTSPAEIHDGKLQRVLRIEKSGSASTVVWNPWTTQPLSDFGSEEYRQMVCVESGNVGPNAITLLPGKTTRIGVVLSSFPARSTS